MYNRQQRHPTLIGEVIVAQARLVPKFKVSGHAVTSEVQSMIERSVFGFWLTVPPEVAVESKFKHRRISRNPS